MPLSVMSVCLIKIASASTTSQFISIMFLKLGLVLLLSSLFAVSEGKIGATKTGTTVGGLAKELADLGVYGSRRAVFVRNRADDWIRVWCSSRDDSTGEIRLNPGESMGFKFKPMVIGGYTVFWCTTDYKGYWARWDAFGHEAPFYYDHKNDRSYEYEVRNDGVYYTGRKFRGLNGGNNWYKLWDHYDSNKNPFGDSLAGHVDNGMCNNVPNWFENRVSSVTVCNGQCVILYSGLHCQGQTSRLHAGNGCSNFWLSHFNDKTKSVKGC